MSADKIKPHRLARRAIVYVRQSSAPQVLHNPESRALQYAMRDRLAALGWSEIEVVDEDLGRAKARRAEPVHRTKIGGQRACVRSPPCPPQKEHAFTALGDATHPGL